jgi:hypothetical protein
MIAEYNTKKSSSTARSFGEYLDSLNTLSRFRLQAGFAKEAKKAVAENVPAFRKKRRRFVTGMTVNLY